MGSLGVTAEEKMLARLDLELWKLYNEFIICYERCEKISNSSALSSNDVVVLHCLSIYNTPLSLFDICISLNRKEKFNTSYTLRKLLKLGLIQQIKNLNNKKTTFYQITELGLKNVFSYAKTRAKIFKEALEAEDADFITQIINNIIRLREFYNKALEKTYQIT